MKDERESSHGAKFGKHIGKRGRWEAVKCLRSLVDVELNASSLVGDAKGCLGGGKRSCMITAQEVPC